MGANHGASLSAARESPGSGPLGHDLVVSILTCDAAVIGGGLVGSALCYELASRGISVVLVDRHDPGRATDAGAGILSPATSPEEDPDWYRLAREAGDYYPGLAAGLAADGPDDPGYGPCGLLSIAREAHGSHHRESESAWAHGDLLRLAN
jgi:glycine/D-amino acid oxidase-like deaminating enzyme